MPDIYQIPWTSSLVQMSDEQLHTFNKKKSSVRFNLTISSNNESSTRDLYLTEPECSLCWYSKQEYLRITIECHELVRKPAVTACEPQPIDTLRGLEHVSTIRHLVAHRARRSTVVELVLQEQERQRKGSQFHSTTLLILDHEKLRKKSLLCSRESQRLAWRLAQQDAQDAIDVAEDSGKLLSDRDATCEQRSLLQCAGKDNTTQPTSTKSLNFVKRQPRWSRRP